MTESLSDLIADRFVKYMYAKRLDDVARLANIWHQDKENAKQFEIALDLLVSTHLSLRLRFPVLLPADISEHDEIPIGPVSVATFDLSEGPGDCTAAAVILAEPR